jgi:Uncharacterized protein conserved in bacteria (DUF2188)
MQTDDIYVVKTPRNMWQVSEGARRLPTLTFRLRHHAIAFGRALACSHHSSMYIRGSGGWALQTTESLTYPVTLD